MVDPSPVMTETSTTNGGFQRQRQRIGIEQPYRDDPYAPASARLESFTAGGLGPLHSDTFEKSKQLPLSRKILNAGTLLCRPCHDLCSATATNTDTDPTATTTTTHNNNHHHHSYLDTFNDLPWSCSIGTTDEHGIWLNRADPAGTIMALFVWILIAYSIFTLTLLAATAGIPPTLSMAYTVLACLALASHVKTTLTDPGAVPTSAVPTVAQRRQHDKLSMCSQCQTFKPPLSHHCRICNRCISRMDHHCPWMNNCIGAGNLKHFCLFLIYTWTCTVFSLLLFGWNYFFCAAEACVFSTVLTQLVRLMTVLSVGAFLFTSSMLMNVVYGIMTGIGTIDRLKKKAVGAMELSDEESIPLSHIFGIQPWYTWILPVDPVFPDYDLVMGYSTPQRLLREQMLVRESGADAASSVVSRDSFGMAV